MLFRIKAVVFPLRRIEISSYALVIMVLFLIIACNTPSSKTQPTKQTVENQQATTSSLNEIPNGQNISSLALQALASRQDIKEFNQFLSDPTLNFFLQSHPQFDFVFFVFPDETLAEVPSQVLDSVKLKAYSDTKFEFFANHISMVSKGYPFSEGVSFNEKPLKLDDNKVLYNNKSVKILEKIPSHERIQIFLIQKPLQS
ncbi:MAG: hypothetical protein IPO62_05115 [Saprospiraceae bacterium]|nr:hypothetical protein [Saprospiraceae bacterium]